MNKTVYTFFLFLLPIVCNARILSDSAKVKVLPVPAIGYSPETKTYLGAVVLFTIHPGDTQTRSSNIKCEFNYTWNKQVIIESDWNFFTQGETWFTKGKLHYSRYPDLYYGIGNTPDTNEIVFNSFRTVAEIYALKNIFNHFFIGINSRYARYNISSSVLSEKYSELVTVGVYGIGLAGLLDNRNNILTPSTGYYVFLNYSFNISKSDYSKAIVDLRHYITINKVSTAIRFYSEFNSSNPPFYDLALLGGDRTARGYYFGRYRERNLTTMQGEIRAPILWRFGLAVFGGVSTIYRDWYHPFNDGFKPNYGMGLRFKIDRKNDTNLRVDYAIGQGNNNGFYVSFGESF